MIHPVTCLCVLASLGSGLYLYTSKHDAQMRDRDIARIAHQAQESRARASLLRAEYDRLGDLERLRELAGQVLTLQDTSPKQYASMADLDRRLPPVGPPPQPAEPQVAQAAQAQVVASVVEPAKPAAPPPVAEHVAAVERPAPRPVPILRPAPAQLAAIQPPVTVAPVPVAPVPAAPAPMPAAPPVPAQRPLVARAAAAELRPTPLLRPTPPVQLPALAPAASPAPPPPRRAPPVTQQAMAGPAELITRPAPPPMVGSSLGMARSMMMTTPVASPFPAIVPARP